ncbi:hypothetical protein D3C86_1747940 [compost metagenome]
MFDWPHLRWHYLGGSVGTDIRLPVTAARVESLNARAKLKTVIDASNIAIRQFDHSSKHDMGFGIGLRYEMSGLNQYIQNGIALGTTIAAIHEPALDLSTLNGSVVSIPQLETRPIVDLFERITTDDFTAP